ISSCIAEHQSRLTALDPDWNEILVRERYALLKRIARKCLKQINLDRPSLTERIDRVTLDPIWGAIVLLSILGLLFYSLFFFAEIPKEWIESGMAMLTESATHWLPAGLVQELVCDGILAGVGAVLSFLPQILILMFCIGMLESTGYMARAAFILDRVMQRVGLQGRSFIPILSSYACAIPGVLATRTIDSPKDRLATILVAPFASCSARLPVYAVMIATLAPGGQSSAWLKASLMLLMYILGTCAAFGFAWLFKRTFLKGSSALGVMELPPYRWPHLSYLLWDMWHRTKAFVTNAGTVILTLSIVLWFALSHPRSPETPAAEQIAQSYGGRLGQWLEPVIEPLGFDWKIGIGIVSSFAAREVFISTLAIVYHVENASVENTTRVEEALRNQV
ncbi:MAG: ferrous iron transporter B, partial [Verrucomicrobia bacterium 21-51-4]